MTHFDVYWLDAYDIERKSTVYDVTLWHDAMTRVMQSFGRECIIIVEVIDASDVSVYQDGHHIEHLG